MSTWDRWGYFKPAPKRPPPAHGIKVKRLGQTWWGQRWIRALEGISRAYWNRLPRGRAYARAGRVHDLVVEPGQVTALVTGTRARPYQITLEIRVLSDAVWKEAIRAMAGQAQFAAELLAGQMPRQIEDVFQNAKASLFPMAERDLVTHCSCPDWANPCKHVAATHYVLGEAFDADPFLLFELRGRTKEQVLASLRAMRAEVSSSDSGSPVKRRRKRAPEDVEAGVRLDGMSEETYDAWRGTQPSLVFRLDRPQRSGLLLKQLGMPSSWREGVSPAELLWPTVRAASERALQRAMAGDVDGETVDELEGEEGPKEGGKRAKRKR